MPKSSTIAAVCVQFLAVLFLMGGCGGGGGASSSSGGSGGSALSPSVCVGASTPIFPTLTPPNGTVGAPYTFTSPAVTAGTPPYTFSLASGTLPTGLAPAPNATTVTLAGTPNTAGSFTFVAQVADACQKTATAQATITINAQAMVLPTLLPPNAAINVPYTYSSVINGGTPPFTANIGAGSLPAGLHLSVAGSTLMITGTATALGGPTNFTIAVHDAGNPVQSGTTAQASITVVNLGVSTAFLPFATKAQAYGPQTLAAFGGVAPLTWSVVSGSLPANIGLSTSGVIAGTPTVTGPQTFTVQVQDNTGATATAILQLNVLPELPRVTIDTSIPAPGGASPIQLTGGTAAAPTPVANIQAVLNSNPPCGSIIKLSSASGTNYWIGNLIFPRHVPECTAATPITITTDDATLPAPGTRVTPADAVHMPKILGNATNVSPLDFSQQPQGGVLVPGANPGGSFYRIVGVEVSLAGPTQGSSVLGSQFDGTLVSLGTSETTPADMPHDIILDRIYIHGNATSIIRRGILMNGIALALIDSNVSDIHQPGNDTQTIAGWNGPGPLKIQNNRLEASGENILFGGAIPPFPTNIPSDIEIRNNYFFKPLAWQTSGFSVKNLLEFKNGQRVLVESNVFENNWASGQAGYAIVLNPRGLAGSAQGPANYTVSELTFRNNLVAHVGSGFNISAEDSNDPARPIRGFDVALLNNIVQDANSVTPISQVPFASGGPGSFLALFNGTPNITLDHNTAFSDNKFLETDLDPNSTPPNRPDSPDIFTNNVVENGLYGVFCSGFGIGTTALNACFDDHSSATPSYIFVKNVVILNSGLSGVFPSNYPVTNQVCDLMGTTCFPPDLFAAGVADPLNCNAGTFDPNACAITNYINAGTDGKTLGADPTQVAKPIAPTVNPVKP